MDPFLIATTSIIPYEKWIPGESKIDQISTDFDDFQYIINKTTGSDFRSESLCVASNAFMYYSDWASFSEK